MQGGIVGEMGASDLEGICFIDFFFKLRWSFPPFF